MADQGDGDRTVIRPMPGGGQRPTAPRQPGPGQVAPGAPPAQPTAPEPAAPSAQMAGQALQPLQPLPGSAAPQAGDQPLSGMHRPTGHNPIVDAAIASLILIQRLRNTVEHNDITGLHSQLVQQVTEFEAAAHAAGELPEIVNAARYCLCTALDEAVLSTPWGVNSNWNAQSLLVTFHKESFGGEKVFQILENAAQDPQRNLNLLEFMYVVISLGFEGKYRVMERGEARLEELRMSLFERLRPYRGEFERELSPHWRGVGEARRGAGRSVPLWVVGAMVGAVIVTSFTAMRFILDESVDPVHETLQKIERPKSSGG